MKAPYLLGTDIGGTFTDCAVFGSDGDMIVAKTPSTPPFFEKGLLLSLVSAADKLKVTIEDLLKNSRHLSHGTTVATNALINQKGARVGFISTKGFEETLWHMRGAAYCQGLPIADWQHKVTNPRPFTLVDPSCCIGISERIDHSGKVLCPLNEQELTDAAQQLIKANGVDVVGIGFLWSFINPVHELQARDIILEEFPHIPVTLSSELAPLLGEYERWSTTALNAFLGPEVKGYIERMLSELAKTAHKGDYTPAHIMQANGGLVSHKRAIAEPVKLLQSGPAGGMVGALELMKVLKLDKVMTADMGGTSFDVCLIDKEAPYVQSSIHNRHAIATRMVDIESIGAGGGSIARVERGNLTVGPDSAGAEPGPVCYSKGGIYPTVTDANAVLGYLNPKALLGGKMSIDVEAARRAVEDNIARLLGMEVEDAALGIVQVVDAHMADLLRFHALSRGHDPRDFSVFCFGGATGLHACGIAEQIGLSKTIVPLGGAATVFSAIGIARCDQKRFFSLSRTFALVAGNAELLVEAFDELMEVVRTQLAQEDIDPKRLGWSFSVSVRYRFQTNELEIPISKNKTGSSLIDTIINRFDKLYTKRFGPDSGYREGGRELLAVHAVGILPTPREAIIASSLNGSSAGGGQALELSGSRMCFFADAGWVETGVYNIDSLDPSASGYKIQSPAVLEAEGTTILVPSNWTASIDAYRNIILEVI